jgi:hypothetical protein
MLAILVVFGHHCSPAQHASTLYYAGIQALCEPIPPLLKTLLVLLLELNFEPQNFHK